VVTTVKNGGSGAAQGVAVGTVIAKNFMARARVFARSFRTYNSVIPLHVLLTDEVDGCFEPTQEPFDLVPISAVRRLCLDLDSLAFGYDRKTLAVAVKPLLMEKLLDSGYDRVVLIDADSLVLGSLDPLFDALDDHDIILSPHRSRPPLGTDAISTDLRLLRTGTFNGGLIGVRESPSVRKFLTWWWTRLERHCRYDIKRGLHLDQRWLDLVPGLFGTVGVLRDERFNVAYWNLDHRTVGPGGMSEDSGRSPGCRLFHFSGYDPEQPELVSSYAPDLKVFRTGAAAELFHTYRALLIEAGHFRVSRWPYAYGLFDNGEPIADIIRDIYLDLGEENVRYGDPFATDHAESFFDWLLAPARGAGVQASAISNLWMEVYNRRRDVQREYPDLEGRDRVRFLEWTRRSGLSEHGISDAFAVSY
jgi:hypothetical protein